MKYEISSPIDRIVSSMSEYMEVAVAANVWGDLNRCESPIEAVLLYAMVAFNIASYGERPSINGSLGLGWNVKLQEQIGEYRVDFLLTSDETKRKFVIECDGHDFHERTKEQALKDRRRDRDLTAAGYVVLRFTGSEIWRDPWRCAEDIEKQIHSAACSEGLS
jgi:very-short-patch-repair endonuclease